PRKCRPPVRRARRPGCASTPDAPPPRARPEGPVDAGNSGTTMRVLAGALAGRPFATTLIGDESLSRRPMRRLVEPLAALGARVEISGDGTPPLVIRGGALRGADVAIPVASAQVRTAVALAALQAEGTTTIDSPDGFRDHTERWLEHMGLASRPTPTRLEIRPGTVQPLDVVVPGDPSSAAFLWAAAALVDGACVTTTGVSLNPGRTGFLSVLREMGAEVTETVTGSILGDPVGDITITGRPLSGCTVAGDLAVRSLDELPLVAVLGAFATGNTVVSDAGELRVKETDRIASSVALVRGIGGVAEPTWDGFVVLGGHPGGGSVDASGDHRIAMAAGVAASATPSGVTVHGANSAGVSWPGFYEALEDLWSSR
ncbi:3-phosphoshikimate 1-carboxyvinyltransferase, partial [bacterium]|nr:3-phosphoshikimate 1-carboxyvinyltransferase [bacterium]